MLNKKLRMILQPISTKPSKDKGIIFKIISFLFQKLYL